MTEPAALPEISYPRIIAMFTDNLVPAPGAQDSIVDWRVGADHPYVPQMKVVAMFADGGVVEIYSLSSTQSGMRDLVPMQRVRLIQEVMPLPIFAEELAASELGDDDGGDDGGEEDDNGGSDESEGAAPSGLPAAPSNGQATT